jgi:hypothetical protein
MAPPQNYPTIEKGDSNMRITEWNGYDRIEFELDGKEGLVVLPHTFAQGRPWVWRAEFFGDFDHADMALLEQGYARAYYRQNDMYGCPEAVEGMRRFQTLVTRLFGLAEKTILFGFSRGGLYAFNYAATYPDQVELLYLAWRQRRRAGRRTRVAGMSGRIWAVGGRKRLCRGLSAEQDRSGCGGRHSHPARGRRCRRACAVLGEWRFARSAIPRSGRNHRRYRKGRRRPSSAQPGGSGADRRVRKGACETASLKRVISPLEWDVERAS